MASAESLGTGHPALSRRRELGATSARSLLLTVLGEFVLPQPEPVWTQTLIDVLAELGVEQKSARQALARTAAEGLLASGRSGRRVRWSLSSSGRQLLTEGAARIYGFGTRAVAWDGRWLVLLVSVPESRRQLRHRLRTRLAWAGLGSPTPGVWVTPHPGKQDEVARVIADLDLTEVTSSIRRPVRRNRGRTGRRGAGLGPRGHRGRLRGLPRNLRLSRPEHTCRDHDRADPPGARVRRFPFLDPALPGELLPAEWAGARAAALFGTLHARWHDPAGRHWRALIGSAGHRDPRAHARRARLTHRARDLSGPTA